MTVKELKQKLENLPENLEVFIEQNNSEFQYSLSNSVSDMVIEFSDGDLKAEDTVVVIRDDN